MKKNAIFLLIICLCLFLSGCKAAQVVDGHISINDWEDGSESALQSIQVDRKSINRILCIQNENFIYSCYENEDTILAFYRYDSKEGLTYRVGEIEYPFVSSGDITVLDDNVFFYYNAYDVMNADTDPPEVKEESALYQIDISENTLQKLADDNGDQTLIYLDSLDGSIISLKGRVEGDKGITYLDRIDISNGSSRGFDMFISKEYDRQGLTGEVIYQFCESDSNIYLLVWTEKSADGISWTIEEYDHDGKYIDEWSLDDRTADALNGERISEFEIYGEYGFVSNFSGRGVLFRISADAVTPVLMSEPDMSMNIAASADGSASDHFVLYSRETGEIWRLDVADDALYKLDLPYEHINYIYLSNDNRILISSDDTLYGELTRIPCEDGNLLVQ